MGRAMSTPQYRKNKAMSRVKDLTLSFLLLGLFLRLEVFARFLVDDAHRQADLAALVEAEELHFHLVAFLDHIARLGDAVLGQLRDVDEAVLRTEEVHEGAEIDDLDDGAVIDLADLRFAGDRLDPIDR